MVALFFHFSKRQNSTKRPNDSDGTEMSISIRGNVPSGQLSSVSGTEYYDTHPTIWVSGNSNYNYVKMPGSNRYYFVRDRQREINDATVYYLEEDYLATWADEIKGSTQKVLLSSNKGNLHIDDLRNVETESTSLAANTANFPFTLPTSSNTLMPCYLITIAGGRSLSTTYVMNEYLLQSLVIDTLYGKLLEPQGDEIISQDLNSMMVTQNALEQTWATTELEALNFMAHSIANRMKNTGTALYNQIAGAFNSIKSLKFSPLAEKNHAHTDDASQYDFVYLGTVNTGQRAPLAKGVRVTQTTINVPHQSSYYQRGKRFSSYGIYVPFCGIFPLSNDDLYNEETVQLTLTLDTVSGAINGAVKAGSNTNKILTTFSGCCTTEMLYSTHDASTITSIVKNIAGGVINVTTAGITGGSTRAAQAFGGSLERLVTGIDQTQIASGGSIGSAAGVAGGFNIVLFSSMKGKADDFEAIKDVAGLQCHQTLALSALSGYCRCADASIDMQGMLSEKEEVISFMNSGFFLE